MCKFYRFYEETRMRFQRQAIGAAIALMVIPGLPSPLGGQATRTGQEAPPAHHQEHQHDPSTQDPNTKPSGLPPAQEGERRLRLEDLEKIALESNPTLAQATSNVRAAEGR